MWLNTYDGSSWKFIDKGVVSGGVRCTQGYGTVENDLGVRFADLTNDGKADYLCIEPNGRVTGYLNRGMAPSGQVTFEDVGQIKLATNYDRQNVRFNDVNGDGRADLLWIDKYTGWLTAAHSLCNVRFSTDSKIGDTTVWYNAGEIPTSGSHFKWDSQGPLYKGWDRGSNMEFGALGGQGRADIIEVIPRSNIAYVSYNECPGGGGGDDPGMGNPQLPPYTPESPLPAECASINTNPPAVDPSTLGQPVGDYEYVFIEKACYGDKTNVQDGFKDRADFITQSLGEVNDLAFAANYYHFPGDGVDASDIYFGEGADDAKKANDIYRLFPTTP